MFRKVVEKVAQHGRQVVEGILKKVEKAEAKEIFRVGLEKQPKFSTAAPQVVKLQSRSNGESILARYLARSTHRSLVAEMRNKFALRNHSGSWGISGRPSMHGGRSSLYAFVGVSLATGTQWQMRGNCDADNFGVVCDEIRGMLKSPTEKPVGSQGTFVGCGLRDFEIGSLIGKGCSAAVYNAKLRRDLSMTEDSKAQHCYKRRDPPKQQEEGDSHASEKGEEATVVLATHFQRVDLHPEPPDVIFECEMGSSASSIVVLSDEEVAFEEGYDPGGSWLDVVWHYHVVPVDGLVVPSNTLEGEPNKSMDSMEVISESDDGLTGLPMFGMVVEPQFCGPACTDSMMNKSTESIEVINESDEEVVGLPVFAMLSQDSQPEIPMHFDILPMNSLLQPTDTGWTECGSDVMSIELISESDEGLHGLPVFAMITDRTENLLSMETVKVLEEENIQTDSYNNLVTHPEAESTFDVLMRPDQAVLTSALNDMVASTSIDVALSPGSEVFRSLTVDPECGNSDPGGNKDQYPSLLQDTGGSNEACVSLIRDLIESSNLSHWDQAGSRSPLLLDQEESQEDPYLPPNGSILALFLDSDTSRDASLLDPDKSGNGPLLSVNGCVNSPLVIINDSVNADGSAAAKCLDAASEYDLAIKVILKSPCIVKTMEKELVPARLTLCGQHADVNDISHSSQWRECPLPLHPNIVDIQGAFVDWFPHLSEGSHHYLGAMPSKLNSTTDWGRSHTLFLVMKRYPTTLREYLAKNKPSVEEGTILLMQLVEAVVHMEQHDVAHRDLKSDNILLDFPDDGPPHLVVSDFGHCTTGGLRVPFHTAEVQKAGNAALRAPEIATAQPGMFRYLDYSKADLWAVGTIAYEIFGYSNPFYRDKTGCRLDSKTYTEQQLPHLCDVPASLQTVVHLMLTKNKTKRPSATQVANMLHLLQWGPAQWQVMSPSHCDVKWWALTLTAEVICRQRCHQSVEHQLKTSFLTRLCLDDIIIALSELSRWK